MLNQCNFIGRLGREVETRYTKKGDVVSSFTLACGEKYKDKQGNQQEKTEWVNVVIWGKLAEIASQYLEKGSLVFISGKFQTRSWEDQQGNKRYTTEIVASEMKMLSGKNEQGRNEGRPESGYPPSASDMGEDVPF